VLQRPRDDGTDGAGDGARDGGERELRAPGLIVGLIRHGLLIAAAEIWLLLSRQVLDLRKHPVLGIAWNCTLRAGTLSSAGC
jgi:hypothetical protein